MMSASSLTCHVAVLEDFNLDLHRTADNRYGPRNLLLSLGSAAKASSLRNLATSATYMSHELYSSDTGPPAPRFSCIDHVYLLEDMIAAVHVLLDGSTVHRPVVTEIIFDTEESAGLKSIAHGKTKDLSSSDINRALESTTNWRRIHRILDLEEVYSFLMGRVNKALNVIAPVKTINVRKGVTLYL
jgi:hypothetical protein